MNNWSYFTRRNGAVTFIEGFPPLCTSTACELQVSADEDFFASRRYPYRWMVVFRWGKEKSAWGHYIIREILQITIDVYCLIPPKWVPLFQMGFYPFSPRKSPKITVWSPRNLDGICLAQAHPRYTSDSEAHPQGLFNQPRGKSKTCTKAFCAETIRSYSYFLRR